MKTEFYLHGCSTHPDGSKDSFWTTRVDSKEAPLPWQTAGLSYTATGYGKRIPMQRMVRFNGRWRRVYCYIFSTSGTCYIGKLSDNLTVSEG